MTYNELIFKELKKFPDVLKPTGKNKFEVDFDEIEDELYKCFVKIN